jgi:hypothetical protein
MGLGDRSALGHAHYRPRSTPPRTAAGLPTPAYIWICTLLFVCCGSSRGAVNSLPEIKLWSLDGKVNRSNPWLLILLEFKMDQWAKILLLFKVINAFAFVACIAHERTSFNPHLVTALLWNHHEDDQTHHRPWTSPDQRHCGMRSPEFRRLRYPKSSNPNSIAHEPYVSDNKAAKGLYTCSLTCSASSQHLNLTKISDLATESCKYHTKLQRKSCRLLRGFLVLFHVVD